MTGTSAVAALKVLRMEIVSETGNLTTEQTLLLADVCQALGLNDNQAAAVVGRHIDLIDSPVPVQITRLAACGQALAAMNGGIPDGQRMPVSLSGVACRPEE